MIAIFPFVGRSGTFGRCCPTHDSIKDPTPHHQHHRWQCTCCASHRYRRWCFKAADKYPGRATCVVHAYQPKASILGSPHRSTGTPNHIIREYLTLGYITTLSPQGTRCFPLIFSPRSGSVPNLSEPSLRLALMTAT